MPDFLREKALKFKLQDLSVTEQFCIWGGWGIPATDPMLIKALQESRSEKFPIREGSIVGSVSLIGVDGVARNMEQIKFMRAAEFKAVYPNLMKQTRYVRTIIFSSVVYSYSFTRTANTALNGLIGTAAGLGQNPLTVEYEQTYDAAQAPALKYQLKISAPGQPGIALPPMPTPIAPIILPTQPVVTVIPTPQVPVVAQNLLFQLTEAEQKILDALLGLKQQVMEEQFIMVYKQNGIADDVRIKSIYQQMYITKK